VLIQFISSTRFREDIMAEDLLGAGPLGTFTKGDRIRILPDGGAAGDWVDARVVSNSASAMTVVFSDGSQEVIPWKSGRICDPRNKRDAHE
jgi:hypothetical protein